MSETTYNTNTPVPNCPQCDGKRECLGYSKGMDKGFAHCPECDAANDEGDWYDLTPLYNSDDEWRWFDVNFPMKVKALSPEHAIQVAIDLTTCSFATSPHNHMEKLRNSAVVGDDYSNDPGEAQQEKDCDYVDMKELIAALIFDYEYEEPDERPHEEVCHALAEEIIERLDIAPNQNLEWLEKYNLKKASQEN